MPDVALWLAALMSGVLGSGHCVGMCGGIAVGLGGAAATSAARPAPAVVAAIEFNLGRLISYAVLGAVVGGLMGQGGEWLAVPRWGQWLRMIAAGLIVAIGLQWLTGLAALAPLERAGARAWKVVTGPLSRAAGRPGHSARWLSGLCWGLLPCGLVYTALALAATTGSATGGAGLMLVFGLGTLPSMLGMTVAGPGLSGLLSDRLLRRVMGAMMVLLGAWVLVSVFWVNSHAH